MTFTIDLDDAIFQTVDASLKSLKDETDAFRFPNGIVDWVQGVIQTNLQNLSPTPVVGSVAIIAKQQEIQDLQDEIDVKKQQLTALFQPTVSVLSSPVSLKTITAISPVTAAPSTV